MAEIGFYHLTRTGLAQVLPALLGRTLALGERACIACPDAGLRAELDRALWQSSDPDWLPHGGPVEGDADLQLVWLDADDVAPNGARFLFLVGGAASARLAAFARVFDLFDGRREAEVAAARERWRAAKAAGHTLTYWQQGDRGWQKRE